MSGNITIFFYSFNDQEYFRKLVSIEGDPYLFCLNSVPGDEFPIISLKKPGNQFFVVDINIDCMPSDEMGWKKGGIEASVGSSAGAALGVGLGSFVGPPRAVVGGDGYGYGYSKPTTIPCSSCPPIMKEIENILQKIENQGNNC